MGQQVRPQQDLATMHIIPWVWRIILESRGITCLTAGLRFPLSDFSLSATGGSC